MSKPLLQRNTRILLIWLPMVLLVSSILFYIVLRLHAHHMQEKQLQLKQLNVWKAFIAEPDSIKRDIPGEYDIVEKTNEISITLDKPQDTLIYYNDKKRGLPFQMLTSQLQWRGQFYYITTYISSTEISHLIIKVFITEAVILVFLLLTIIILNRKSSGLLWRPFFHTMSVADKFDIIRNNQLTLPEKTGTTEFDKLNAVLKKLIEHVNIAYSHQKQFVENASHETQTPLAIIRSKLELLINQPNITERTAALLGDITEATNRLSQMNRTLLLLAKIENNQFLNTEEINISQVIEGMLESFMAHYDNCPEITTVIKQDVIVKANRSLIEILISNIINNAIVHNNGEGKINIVLDGSSLVVKNTGDAPSVPTAELFERFKKGSYQQKTTGLGLSLVKQISQYYHYRTTYEYNNGWHCVSVFFR